MLSLRASLASQYGRPGKSLIGVFARQEVSKYEACAAGCSSQSKFFEVCALCQRFVAGGLDHARPGRQNEHKCACSNQIASGIATDDKADRSRVSTVYRFEK